MGLLRAPCLGARAYFFRSVFHDWFQADAKAILTNIADAMKPGYSKLVIQDLILPDHGADLRQASLDITMYFMPEGIERTLGQWKDLLDSVGLQINRIWSEPSGIESVIEAELKNTRSNRVGLSN